MSALSYLLASNTSLTAEQTGHLQQLVAEWQLLSDMSFADLLLWVPIPPDGTFLCAAQCRPTTGPTAYLHDRVGEKLPEDRAGALQIAMAESRIFRESRPGLGGRHARSAGRPSRSCSRARPSPCWAGTAT